MPPQLRKRTAKVKPQNYTSASRSSSSGRISIEEPTASPNDDPPIYTIDLSLAPHERYIRVATDYRHILRQMPVLFDETVEQLMLPTWFFHTLARLLLRRVYSDEQTEELSGISKVCNLPMYFLVAYNVFLDLFMGCTSGGVMVDDGCAPTMMHFRTLDWSMPLLRQAIVRFHFVGRPDGEVIATTVGYVGFVGVLTGVKKGLSVSLNFRPYHNAKGLSWANARYYWNTLLVLLGRRSSIASTLRDFLVPRAPHDSAKKSTAKLNRTAQNPAQQSYYTPSHVTTTLPNMSTTAAYLIFCTGQETIILEKDLNTSNVTRSSTFISVTNHDVALESANPIHVAQTQAQVIGSLKTVLSEVIDVDESMQRKNCLTKKWSTWKQEQRNMMKRGRSGEVKKSVKLEALMEWMREYPVCNEETHFICVMDPKEGLIRWVRRFEDGEIETEN